MHPILRNILAVLAGLVVGNLINMGIITISSSVIPLPEGADNSTMEGLAASMHLFQPKHFLMPFLAHALGTLAGAFTAAKIAVSHQMKLAFLIGILFLIGGITAVIMIPAPMWFNTTDLALAYLPMAYIGGKLALKKSSIQKDIKFS